MQDRLNQILATRRALLQLLYRRSSIALAVGLHLAAVLFLFLGPVLFAERKQEWEYVDVQIVPASALPQPAPRTATDPPQRDPEPAPPEPVPVESDPEPPEPDRPQLPTEVPEEPPDTEPPEPEPPAPGPEPPVDPTTEPVETTASSSDDPGDPSQDPTSGTGTGAVEAPRTIAEVGPAGVIGFDDASFTYSYYVDRMLAAIAAQWTRPPVGRDIELIVHFVITSNGSVDQLEIVAPSGIRAFDRAGERAVLSASPLPPLPRSYRKDSLGVTLIIQ